MTIEIQAPYRLILAESPQQVMALQTYIQAAYTLEFNARIPHFQPCLLHRQHAVDQLTIRRHSFSPSCRRRPASMPARTHSRQAAFWFSNSCT